MAEPVPIVAIDGPTGSGKGTIARALASKLGWHLLDSGALYRVVALISARDALDIDDVEGLAAAASGMEVEFSATSDSDGVLLSGADVTAELRTEACGAAASKIAAIPLVREALLERQRAFAQPPGLVADGRDMGSVVFPNAILKVFLTATPEERARRRHNQLKEKGIDVSLPALSREIRERDERDANREVAPLTAAQGAHILDSTGMTPDEVVGRIERWLANALQAER